MREGFQRSGARKFPVGRFGRMFPLELEKPPPASEDALKKLADSMIDQRPAGENNNRNIPAGYTYLGQFIDHDITLDLTSLTEADRDPVGELNFRTPQLELDSVYATGPNGDASPHLFERMTPGALLIGRTGPGGPIGDPSVKGGLPFDLPRNTQGLPLIGDARNDENLLVSQTHLAFLKFHNAVLAHEGRGDFDETRRLVRWHYQWIVLNDFLDRIIDYNDVHDVLTNGRRFYLPETQSDYGQAYIPVEFSGAAYRLGHSMVRSTYNHNRAFNDANPQFKADFTALFHFTGKSGGIIGNLHEGPAMTPEAMKAVADKLGLLLPFVFPDLPGDWIIDWHRFYELGAPKAVPPGATPQDNKFFLNHARLFDPFLVRELHALPRGGGSLPLRNLQRGYRLELPSGQAAARHMSVRVMTEAEITSGPDGAALKAIGLHKATPLWYYILKEAQIHGNGGNRLGPVGSRILAEVFLGLLQTDPQSFFSSPGWKPSLPSASPGTFTMPDLLRYVASKEPGFLDPINEPANHG
ncbi:heme peroxidase family protein [Roseococcus sp. SYP-B2431]|uniref:peroxidase family protein n=1 Tax=Roseococcus sp. SYP-B2431 TaxID=2496640 RepID=UPI0013F47C32|nr:heme peroxidase family protein [Roseococcus sp. SYP-B2431]